MKLAIMQPYMFPYIGYWQLISTVDAFVIYDDVNYIKQGYINRNSILAKTKAQIFTLETIGASSNKLINEVCVGGNRKKLLKTIEYNYLKAPFFQEAMPVIEEIIVNTESNLAKYVGYSIKKIAEYLRISTLLIYSSEINKDCNLRGQDKVIDICKNLKAHIYINSIGGQELYSKCEFKKSDIDLKFLKTKVFEYKQFENEFVPYLSIIDIMMFNDVDGISTSLQNFDLI